jgi:hypothetical protein
MHCLSKRDKKGQQLSKILFLIVPFSMQQTIYFKNPHLLSQLSPLAALIATLRYATLRYATLRYATLRDFIEKFDKKNSKKKIQKIFRDFYF